MKKFYSYFSCPDNPTIMRIMQALEQKHQVRIKGFVLRCIRYARENYQNSNDFMCIFYTNDYA